MSSVGSFGTFTTARLGIYASQKGLSVTGNNIANINTVGYTRQRLDQVSFKTGGADRYKSPLDVHVGNGVLCKSVSQLRDPYLDIRYRTENSSVGFHNAKLNGLNEIAKVIDEVGKGEGKDEDDGLLFAQFSDFFQSLSALKTDGGTEVNDTLVHASADILTDLFHSAAKELETQRVNMESQMRQTINDINSILSGIRDLNAAIRKSDIHGDAALEMRDDRNVLIDQLSEYIKINVTYSEEDIGAGQSVEKLTIRLGNANPDTSVKSDSAILVDGIYATQITTPKANKDYVPLYDANSSAYRAAKKLLEANDAKDPADRLVEVEVDDGLGNKVKFANMDALKQAVDTADPAIKCAYLDENGDPTSDPKDAIQEFDSQYNLTLDQLLDSYGRPWVDSTKPVTKPVKDQSDFPTKAKYTAELTVSGTWKAGDKITVGGQTIEVGVDINVADANTPKLLARAIRTSLSSQDAYKDYEVTTLTTGNKIALTLTAREAGEKNPGLANINIATDANNAPLTPGGVTIANPPVAADPATNPKTYTAALTIDKPFNNGDVITVGTQTITVGQDIGVTLANDPNRLAEALAQKMTVPGYTVSASKGSLVFTQQAGTTADPTVPAINVTAPTPGGITSANGTFTNGKDGNPKDIADTRTSEPVDNGDGTFTTVTTTYFQEGDQWYEVTTNSHTSTIVGLDDNDIYGAIQAVRELLTEEGEFASKADIAYDESAAIKRGIPYYQKSLDLLARTFADTFNEANTGYAVDEKGNYLNKNGEILKDADGNAVNQLDGLTAAQSDAARVQFLKDSGAVSVNGQGHLVDAAGKEVLLAGSPVSVTDLTAQQLGAPAGITVEQHLAGATIDKDGFVLDGAGNQIIVPATGEPLKAGSFTTRQTKEASDGYLESLGGDKMGGPLFSNRGDNDDPTGITAANISVSHSWSAGDIHVVTTFTRLFGGEVSNTTQTSNVRHMCTLMDAKLVYNPQDLDPTSASAHLFEGSFQEMMIKMGTILGDDRRTSNTTLETHYNQALEIDTNRDSVSAVDLNDEAMNLMQYTHSLNAAYRLMTTIDEALERLITGTGVTR